MSRKVFLVAFGITFGYLSSTFYGQQQGSVAEPPQQLLPPVVESPPTVTEQDLKTDPLLNEITDMFLKDGSTNRKLEYPKDARSKSGGKSSSVYHAAELLLKAARILEADDSNAASESQRVAQLRGIAAEMIK